MPPISEELRLKLPSVLAWIQHTLAAHANRARTVSSVGFSVFPDYFDRSTLDRAKVVVVDRLSVPPLTRMGLAQFAEMERFTQGGITFLDTFFMTVGAERDESRHFHELIHVIQWQRLGSERFLLHYAEGLQAHGYRHSPLEVMAYNAQDRFNQAIIFDVEKHVAERLRALGYAS